MDKSKFGLSFIPIHNITIEMCERTLKDIGPDQIKYIPIIDRKIDTISDDVERKEYEKWISSFSEEEKQSYREWYEGKIIDYIREQKIDNIFTDIFNEKDETIKIPPEAITINIINAYLQVKGAIGIGDIPIPSKLTNYNDQYEDIILSAISMIKEKNYLDENNIYDYWDILEKIPKEYRTDKVILEAVRKHHKYLEYADIESENFEELLQIGYKNKLESIGRTSLTEREIELMKKFAKNNSSLFSTLKIEILNPEIVNSIGENNIERISKYGYVQNFILRISKNNAALNLFYIALESLKQDDLFVAPLIEKIALSINHIIIKDAYRKGYNFLQLVGNRIQNNSVPLTEEEKAIISYLALNSKETLNIKSYDDILNFVTNKNIALDEIMNSKNLTLIDAKNAYFERIVGINYENAIKLINKYGNDPEQLLKQYEGKDLRTYKEKSEKEALEIIIKLKSLVQEKNLRKIRQAYKEAVEKEDKTKSFERYKQSTILDNTLRRAYGRNITQTLDEHNKENNIETIERTKDGRKCTVKKISGSFTRMISVMNAYRKSDAEIEKDMYDRWNTSKMSENHALCYSFINQSNPGTAMLGDKKGIIISINGFDAEAVTAVAPYDLYSNSRSNTTITDRQQRFYTTHNLPNQTRRRYSEIDIEIQDNSGEEKEYKKIQPASIICFEEVDEDSINAAIELSKSLGKTIPIELIDRRELAMQEKAEIDALFKQFQEKESLKPELVEKIINKFNNCRNAYMDCSLSVELVGEQFKDGSIESVNENAIFNKKHLNTMLLKCIDEVKRRIEQGNVQEGLDAIEKIRQLVKEEREKNCLMPSAYQMQVMSGIDLDIDYSLNEIQRAYGTQERLTNYQSESIEVIQNNTHLGLNSFILEKFIKKLPNNMPKQISVSEFKENINFMEIKNVAEEIYQKGYYSKNKLYSEEHIIRTYMFANTIANMEGLDSQTRILLGEAVKYYSTGRMLDSVDEKHQKYSSMIAKRELDSKYSKEDVGVIQAVFELQGFQDLNENARAEKIAELCSKYGLDLKDSEKIDIIETYMSDAINLDKIRFVKKANNLPEMSFSYDSLKTDTAKKLVECSYYIQDELSARHLEKMSKIANVNFMDEANIIMKEFFTAYEPNGMPYETYSNSKIVLSPIVQEEYFKHKYKEINDPVQLGIQLEKEQKIAEKESIGTLSYTEQQIGKATINATTAEKDAAQSRIDKDRNELYKTQEEQESLK